MKNSDQDSMSAIALQGIVQRRGATERTLKSRDYRRRPGTRGRLPDAQLPLSLGHWCIHGHSYEKTTAPSAPAPSAAMEAEVLFQHTSGTGRGSRIDKDANSRSADQFGHKPMPGPRTCPMWLSFLPRASGGKLIYHMDERLYSVQIKKLKSIRACMLDPGDRCHIDTHVIVGRA